MATNQQQTYECRFCRRTFTDAGVFMSHNCEPQPKTDVRRAYWQAHTANLSDCWLAVDVTFEQWKGQRVAA